MSTQIPLVLNETALLAAELNTSHLHKTRGGIVRFDIDAITFLSNEKAKISAANPFNIKVTLVATGHPKSEEECEKDDEQDVEEAFRASCTVIGTFNPLNVDELDKEEADEIIDCLLPQVYLCTRQHVKYLLQSMGLNIQVPSSFPIKQ